MAGGGAGALILFVCPAPLCPPGPIEVGDYSMAQLAPGTFNRNITRIILIKYFRYSFIIILLLISFYYDYQFVRWRKRGVPGDKYKEKEGRSFSQNCGGRSANAAIIGTYVNKPAKQN